MAVKKGLGRGIDSLIPTNTEAAKSKKPELQPQQAKLDGPVSTVKISKIEPNREQPRKNFDEDALQELSDSIKQYGLIQPIVVQDRGDHYEIIAGERRWRASKMAGLKEVPVIIKHYTEQEIVEISLIENIQREDLNPIEEARAYKRLLEEFNMKQDEVAERVSKSRSAVTNSVRLLKLCDEVQQMLIDGRLTTGHARALIAVEDTKLQYELAQQAMDLKLSVREVEKLVHDIGKPKKEKIQKADNEQLKLIYSSIEERLKTIMGTKIAVKGKEDGTGTISIDFYSHDDLERIVEQLQKP